MFQAQNRETINSTWKVAVAFIQDHYDDERDKIVFHKTTPDLQDQDQSVQDQDQDRFFWSQTGLVLRPTVSDHFADQQRWEKFFAGQVGWMGTNFCPRAAVYTTRHTCFSTTFPKLKWIELAQTYCAYVIFDFDDGLIRCSGLKYFLKTRRSVLMGSYVQKNHAKRCTD